MNPANQNSASPAPSSSAHLRRHAIIDYAVGVALLLAPWVMHAERLMPEISRALGAVIITYTLISKLPYTLLRLIPLPAHLTLDLVMAIMVGGSPIHFGSGTSIAGLHVFLGIVLGLNAISGKRHP